MQNAMTQEREKERERERERERGKKEKRNGKTSWKAEAVKVWSWLEVGSERKRGEKTRGWESFEYFANLVSRVEIAHARISSRETRSPFLTFRSFLFFLAHSFPFFTSHPPLILSTLSASLHRGTKSFAYRLKYGISNNLSNTAIMTCLHTHTFLVIKNKKR